MPLSVRRDLHNCKATELTGPAYTSEPPHLALHSGNVS